MGQFERTLIIADEGSYVHYVEGCTAPIYSSDSLHSAVVEIIVKKNARVRYTTIQNWSNNVYNLVTKRTAVHEGGRMEWIDGNIGSKVTMTLTSAACPLTDVIEDQTAQALDGLVASHRINWVWMPPWGPDKITDDGREQLRALGFNV